MLSKKAIQAYQANYKKEFGTELSEQEAQLQGTKLLRLFKLIYKPIPKVWLDERIKKRERGDKKCQRHSR